MVERKEYLAQLWAWKDEQQIKVVTGIRRCGKSVLLEQYQQRVESHQNRLFLSILKSWIMNL